VGTSYTEYRRSGFWTRDAALETVLALPELPEAFWFVDGNGRRAIPVHRP
jgi:hypothetical protein